MCEKYFEPTSKWGDVNGEQVAVAIEELQDQNPALKGRPDAAKWCLGRGQQIIYKDHCVRSYVNIPNSPEFLAYSLFRKRRKRLLSLQKLRAATKSIIIPSGQRNLTQFVINGREVCHLMT